MSLVTETLEKAKQNFTQPKYSARDFQSNQDVRWCPGCGDYSILAQVQRTMPEFGVAKHNIVWVSGIGCSSRFPYYMDTYGFHGIHGRATAIATGVKISRPDLSVWVATGDGDGMSIGGNHFIHTLRRNVDIKIVLFNNQIYGLTKGQYSPTSLYGQVTKSTPYGNIDHPFIPALLALGAEGSFVARTLDRDPKHMQYILKRAGEHKGTAFVEIYQNCNVFNDGAFFAFTEKDTRDDTVLILEHGKPMVFGKEKTRGIKLDGFTPKVVTLGDGISVDDLLVHNEKDSVLAFILASFSSMEGMPRPIGIFRAIERPTYDADMETQVQKAAAKKKGSLNELLGSGQTWEIK